MKKLDMTGKPCPMPVVEAKKALAETNCVEVIVDNDTAIQNLSRLAASLGGTVQVVPGAGIFTVTITLSGPIPQDADVTPVCAGANGPTVLITSDQMGSGSEELGKILIKGYIFSLTQLDPAPAAVYLLNAGVKLAAEGANTVPDLRALEEKGVIIRCCGTCLNFYELGEQRAVGQVTDMMGISTALATAEKLIVL